MKKFYLAVLSLCVFSAAALGSDPTIWSVNSRADVLKGDARSVSIDQNGTITPAPKLTEVYNTDQAYIWSSVVDAAGNVYLGTGGDGRIFKVGADGKGVLFTDLNELNVSALAIGKGGEIFAATSPDGKVYQIDAAGKASVYFDAKEKYIWSLAVMNDGSLAVGTGEGGKIFRVRSANATPESSLFFDTSETHIITLAVDSRGNLYAGTDSNGIVMKFGPDGKPFALLDSPLREIKKIKIAPDGTVYVLAVGETASTAAPAATPVAAVAVPENKTVSAARRSPQTPEPAQKSRYDLTSAKSAVYRILPDGGSDILWASTTITGFSLHAHRSGNGVLLGTSDKGRIYGIAGDGAERLVLQSDANQISTITASGESIYATSSNGGKLFRFGNERVAEGVYESAVLDANASAAWGRIWWRSTGGVDIQTRSGNTELPQETWSGWSAVSGAAGSGRITSPKAKFLQWRAVLKGPGDSAALNELSLSYLPRNIAPEILSIQILSANVGLIANPPIQIDPNIELSGLDPQAFGVAVAAVAPRRAFQRGAQAFQWTSEDRNGDKMLYDIHYKGVGDANFRLLRSDFPETFFTLDGQSLADGRYVIKITAKDSADNPLSVALASEKISEPFDIDNTQPTVTAVPGDKTRVVFAAADKSGYLVRAEYSINGGEWRAVYADDGISDSPAETYTITLPAAPGDYDVTLRVFDASGNAGNARQTVRK